MRHAPDDPELLPSPPRRDEITEALFAPLEPPAPSHVVIVPSSRGRTCEGHVMSAGGTLLGCYRFRESVWQHRPGYGEPWEACEAPEFAPDILQRLVRGH